MNGSRTSRQKRLNLFPTKTNTFRSEVDFVDANLTSLYTSGLPRTASVISNRSSAPTLRFRRRLYPTELKRQELSASIIRRTITFAGADDAGAADDCS